MTAKGRKTVLSLGTEPGIRDMEKLYAKAQAMASKKAAVHVDLSEIARCDAAVVQLLIAFAAHRREKKLKLEWIDPSDAFLDIVRRSGMAAAVEPTWAEEAQS